MTDFTTIAKEIALRYTNEAILLLDKNAEIVYTTEDINQICDLNRDHIIGQSFFSFIHHDDKKKLKRFFSSVRKTPQKEHAITYRISENYSPRKFVKTRMINLLNDPNAEVVAAYCRDITNQKEIKEQLQEKIKENETLLHHYKFIADNTIDVIFQVTLSGTYTYMNKASKRIAGYDPEEMIGKKWMSYVPKKELPKYLSKVKELLNGKKIDDFQTFVIHKEGHLVPVEFSGNVIKRGNKTFINGVMRDLSKRLNSKRELEQIARLLEKQAKAKTKQFQESEKKYRQLIEHANEAIIVAQDNYITLANPNALDLLGYDKEEIFSKTFNHFIHPDDAELVINRHQQRLKGKHPPSRYEFRIIDKNNTIHWVEISAVQINWDNKPATLNFLTDITQRKTLQDKYERLFNNSPEFLAEVDGETLEILTVNQQMSKSIGVPKEKIIGKTWSELLPANIYEKRYKIGLEVLKENKTTIFIDKRGDRYFRNIFTPIEYPNGKRNLQVLSQDITEMESAKQNLIDNEEQLRAITTSAKDAIILIDNKGMVQFWNPAAETIFGYTADEMIGKNIHHILSKETVDNHFKKGFSQFQKKGTGPVVNRSLELIAQKKDGKTIVIELSVSTLKLKNKWHAIGIARDITDRKHMQEALRKSRNRLEIKVKERTAELQASERKYHQLFEIAPVGIAIADLHGNIYDMNKTMEKITGFSLKNITQFDFDQHYVKPRDRNKLRKQLRQQGSISNLEIELKRATGEQYTALMDVERLIISGETRFLVIERDITDLKHIRQEIIETRNYLKNVIDSATELIIAVNKQKQITMWNKTAEQTTGLSSKEAIGKSILNLPIFKESQIFSDAIRNLTTGYEQPPEECVIRSKTKEKSIIRFSASIIDQPETKQTIGVLFVGTDVTKQAIQQGRLIDGVSYLLLHSTSNQAIELFIQTQLEGYHGLCFTRKTSVSMKKTFSPSHPDVFYYQDLLSSSQQSEVFFDRIQQSLSEILSDQNPSIIYIDRIDYLITLFSFDHVLQLLYRLTPVIASHQAILLLRVNPHIINDQQLHLLKEEFFLVPSEKVEPIELDEHLYEILQYINSLNARNIVVSFQKVGKRFSISKVTTKKRLDALEQQGLITVNIKGRMKSVHVTKKAQLLLKRQETS